MTSRHKQHFIKSQCFDCNFRNPNNGTKASSLTVWPEYDTVSQKYIRLTSNVTSFSVETRMEANRMHFWNTIVPALENECDRECECERSGNSEEAD